VAADNFIIKRAILSVYDKSGIVPLANVLSQNRVEIYATGKTFEVLQREKIPVRRIEQLTHFPEILGGRVKTLHPAVFGGILADVTNPQHLADLQSAELAPFQLVVINLYPFVAAYQAGKSDLATMVELIDIGGPSMLRAAAKNFKNVVVLSEPTQYEEFIDKFQNATISINYRHRLAWQVFSQTSAYDATIAQFLAPSQETLPDTYQLPYRKMQSLRYGENPDQGAALYAPYYSQGWQPFDQIQGKEISYNNYIDCLAVYQLVSGYDTDKALVAIVKHTNPCGVGLDQSPVTAYRRAVATDPVSYFGGIVGTNHPVDGDFAEELTKSFLECIVAPAFSETARSILSKKKNLRLLVPRSEAMHTNFDVRQYGQGLLVQTLPLQNENMATWQVVTERKPAPEDWPALRLAWHVVKQVKSNAIVFCTAHETVGIGAGQMSRVDAVKIAIRKAQEAGLSLRGTIMASDAFFPFRDSVDLAADQGIAGIVQPGGSLRDSDSIAACNEKGIFMLFTGKRVFKH
jgi:phosphoribosylaminoimidazolecarboxamide formyltransferase/IMP cyclohydrolase